MAGEWESGDPARLLELFALNLDAYAETDARHGLAQVLARMRHRLNRNSLPRQPPQYRGALRSRQRLLRPVAGFLHDLLGRPVRPGRLADPGAGAQVPAHTGPDRPEAGRAHPGDRLWLGRFRRVCGAPRHAGHRSHAVAGAAVFRAAPHRRGGARRSVSSCKLCDYRDFDQTVDHIVSIEMFEAVGQEYWQGYFATLMRCLRPGGRAALQVITIDEAHFRAVCGQPGWLHPDATSSPAACCPPRGT